MRSSRSWVAVVALLGLASTACADAGESADDRARDPDSADDGNGDPEPADDGDQAPGPPADPDATTTDDRGGAGPEVIDDDCSSDIDRCGTVLGPAGDDSTALVASYFTLAGVELSNRPLFVLRDHEIDSEVAAAFTDRPVVTVETRGGWRSPPEVDCPEIAQPATDVVTAWARCRARIAAGGFDVAATDVASLAADVLGVADALGYDELDLVASGFSAPVALYAATLEPSRVGRLVLHRPVDPSVNVIAQHHTDLEAALQAVWTACAGDDGCATDTGLGAFLDLIAALDDAPIELPARNPAVDDTPVSLDARRLLDLLEFELHSAAGARTVLDVPAWLAARSLPDLGRLYDDVPPATTNAADLAWICATLDQPYELASHALFVAQTDSSVARAREVCEQWTLEPPEVVDYDVGAADVVTVVSAGDPQAPGRAPHPGLFGDVIVVPSLGAPPAACLVDTAERWLREGEAGDTPACTRPPDFRSPDATIELVDAAYRADWFPGEVTLVAPASWGDGSYGYWARGLDSFDPTSLDVWLHEDATVDEVESRLPADAELVIDEPSEPRATATAKWRVLRGTSTWADDERAIVGIGGFGDVVVEVRVRGRAAEIERLANTVFDPVLDSVDYSP